MRKKLLLGIFIVILALSALVTGYSTVHAADALVIQGDHDSVERVLDRLGIEYDIAAKNQLGRYDLNNYKQLYLNCGCEFNDTLFYRVERFVEDHGGSLYVSDWGSRYLDHWGIDFRSTSIEGETTATINDIGLRNYLGQNEITVRYNDPKWRVIAYKYIYDTLLSGNITSMYTEYEGDRESAETSPLAISFKAGRGNIVYITFHNSHNIDSGGSDMLKAVEYFAMKPKTDTVVQAALENANLRENAFRSSANTLSAVKANGIPVPQGENGTYIFAVTDMVLDSGDQTPEAKTCSVELFGPDGVSYGTKDVTGNTPALFQVTDSKAGEWKFLVNSYSGYNDNTIAVAASVGGIADTEVDYDVGGGCNYGFGAVALAIFAIPLLFKRGR